MQSFVRPVILMRPGAANDRLAGRLNNLGLNVWKWPAFTILPPEDSERVQQRLSHLECFDMVFLASPAAVAAAARGEGLGASFTAAENVLYSSALMVRKKFSCLAGLLAGCTEAGFGVAGTAVAGLNCTWGRSGALFKAPSTP